MGEQGEVTIRTLTTIIIEAINAKTKAIIVVHLYGNLVNMDKVLSIAKKYNISPLDDSITSLVLFF